MLSPDTSPSPLYATSDLHPAYQLRFGWSAWPSGMLFPEAPTGHFWDELKAAWEQDGLRVLEVAWSEELIQITFSAKPKVSPVLLASRAKGRLEHMWRVRAEETVRFSRKVAVRSFGDAARDVVEAYINGQVAKECFIDTRFEQFMRQFTIEDKVANLALPTETSSGRYWYNLHLVLVTVERFQMVDEPRLRAIRDGCLAIAKKKGCRISRLSVMPDHLHLALRGDISNSPEDVALAFLNNLAFLLGQKRLWSWNYCVGTFGEYDMGAVRKS